MSGTSSKPREHKPGEPRPTHLVLRTSGHTVLDWNPAQRSARKAPDTHYIATATQTVHHHHKTEHARTAAEHGGRVSDV